MTVKIPQTFSLLPVELKHKIFQWLILDNEVMINKIEETPTGPVLESYRPTSMNQLRYVDRATRNVFDKFVSAPQVYELRIQNEVDLHLALSRWRRLVTLEQVQHVRLIVDMFTNDDFSHDKEAPKFILYVLAELIKNFTILRDLEIFFLFEATNVYRCGWDGERKQLTLDFAKKLEDMSSLQSIRVSTMRVELDCPDVHKKSLVNMSTSTKVKTASGWTWKILENSCKITEHLQDAHKLGLKIDDGETVLVPSSDKTGDLTGYEEFSSFHYQVNNTRLIARTRRKRDGTFERIVLRNKRKR